MEKEVLFKMNGKEDGFFYIRDHQEQIARMDINISSKTLSILHTEVNPAYEGNGLAKKMFLSMINCARENQLKVNPLCPYVNVQFKKNPGEYSDVLE